MTGDRYLLDTNIIIDVFANNRAMADKINSLPALFISTVVLGELYTGIHRVIDKDRHLKKLNDFLHLCNVVIVDSHTSAQYGKVIAELYTKGRPIPTNDAWIAATALQHNLTLVTKDHHFSEVSGLLLQMW